jgi:hypothetical protein
MLISIAFWAIVSVLLAPNVVLIVMSLDLLRRMLVGFTLLLAVPGYI